jgi:hypothetical protein
MLGFGEAASCERCGCRWFQIFESPPEGTRSACVGCGAVYDLGVRSEGVSTGVHAGLHEAAQGGFDRKLYQREYMRRRRASEKASDV